MTSINQRLLILISAVLLLAANLFGQAAEPVPFISQPLDPTSVVPGYGGVGGFAMIVNGTGFTPNSIVQWNGNARTTTFVSSSQVTADISAADVATATTAWVTVDNAPPAARSNVVFFHVTNSTASVLMSKTDYPGGDAPIGVATGDFNGDSELDLAVAIGNGSAVGIQLGNGNGTFQTQTTFATGFQPWSVATADFNGDGKLDLAVTNSGTNTVSILLGNGNGTFQAQTTVTTGLQPKSVMTADFNGDGSLDLAVANQSSDTVSILLGNGDGTFLPQTTFATGSQPWSVATGDLNGDGQLDLAVANGDNTMGNTVSILLGNGDGTFLPTVPPTFATGTGPRSVTAADFNGDGMLDLAVANILGNTVSILLGNGDGTFQAQTPFATGSLADSVTTGDFNGDGALDLAAANYIGSYVAILLGNGDGTFQAQTPFTTGQDPFSVATGDFNGDGRLDLAVSNFTGDTVSVLLQTVLAPAVQLSTTSLNFGVQLVNTTSAAQQVTLTNTGTATMLITSFNVQRSAGNSIPSLDFSQNNDCGASLSATVPCTINVLFTPTVAGPLSAVVKIVSNAPGSPHFISLSGTGLSAGVITPSVPNLDFGSHPVGTVTTQKFTITNTGAGSMNIQGMTFTGNFALDVGTTTCPTIGPLASNASCDIGVKFSAYTLGANSGELLITHDAAGSPTLVPLTGTGTPVAFAKGEIFLSAGDGTVQRRSASGQLIQILDTQTFEETEGLAFDSNGNLYVAAFVAGLVKRFDPTGVPLGNFGSGYSGSPESIIFDKQGSVYVGSVDGDNDVRKFDPAGSPLTQFDVAFEGRGSDWIDLAPDQCTLYYTSEGIRILRFNVCTNTQLPDFTSSLPGFAAYALRLLPSGGLLVADSEGVLRLDANGNIIKTYLSPGVGVDLFALNLDPDGTSFWTADFVTTDVYKFDIATGDLLFQFNAGTPIVSGLVIKGEITSATAPQISLSTASVNFPGNPVNLTCPTKTVTVTNTGDAALNFTGISITSPFSLAAGTTCSTTNAVAPGGTCLLQVKFTPIGIGAVNGILTLTSNAVASPHTVALSGNGTPACALLVAGRSVTVLRGTDVQDFAVEDAKPSCSPVALNLTCSVDNPAACLLNPAVIAPSGASTLKVSNLRRIGAEALQVTVTSTSEFRTASELVTVRFADFAFTQSPDAATVAAGGVASYAVAIRPVNGLAGNLALACSGAPRGATCSVEPSSITLDGTSLAQVKVKVTTTSGAGALPMFNLPSNGSRRTLPLLLGLMALLTVAAIYDRRRSPVRTPALQRALLATTMLTMLVWASCGGGGSMNFGSNGTPAGTYTLTITGTYSSATGATPGTLANSTTVTLRVN